MVIKSCPLLVKDTETCVGSSLASYFVLISLVSFYFVFISLISFRFVSFLLISFRFVFVDFVSFRFVSFLFRFALYRYPGYSTNKSDSHNITEILLKVALKHPNNKQTTPVKLVPIVKNFFFFL